MTINGYLGYQKKLGELVLFLVSIRLRLIIKEARDGEKV